jgi:hypothetical protein
MPRVLTRAAHAYDLMRNARERQCLRDVEALARVLAAASIGLDAAVHQLNPSLELASQTVWRVDAWYP